MGAAGISPLARLREHAYPYLEELCGHSSLTVNLAVLDAPEVLYLARAKDIGRHARQEGLPQAESRLPVHCTAMGKLLLAFSPEPEQAWLLREMTLTSRTPNTTTGKRALRQELKRIHADGFAVNDQELTLGVYAIAVPIRAAGHEVIAALGMTAPTAAISLDNLVSQLKPHLIATADRISARLGYR